jgi:16S rRNA (cytidine1402-2'-O)-methyltransferase
MSGILYVVATPIGNLEDVTLRALRILREVSLIAAEDTRRTGRLLQHYSISTPTTSLHEHNERQKGPQLVRRLLAGESIALVSDAGTPVISDPGQSLVAAAREAGIRVEPVPGPSAVAAIASVAGISMDEFVFMGFPPVRSSDRQRWFQRVADLPSVAILFEAPHRIDRLIGDMTKYLGAEREVVVGRELTKAHEEVVKCQIRELPERISAARGEFVVLIPPQGRGELVESPNLSREAVAAEVGQMVKSEGMKRREALRSVAVRYGVSVNRLYKLLEEPGD